MFSLASGKGVSIVATKNRHWDGFVLPEDCDQMTASRMLEDYSDNLIGQGFKDALEEVLKQAKQEVERTGGDWAVSGPSVENMLENLRRCVRSSMVPDEVLNRMPIPMM
ncbi:MAG: hypothetical protein HY093_03250 [Candidatus Liptonbacteria bacterium]|nr:hypothetical protein [Candidatus Liptonbacteria bacterium]